MSWGLFYFTHGFILIETSWFTQPFWYSSPRFCAGKTSVRWVFPFAMCLTKSFLFSHNLEYCTQIPHNSSQSSWLILCFLVCVSPLFVISYFLPFKLKICWQNFWDWQIRDLTVRKVDSDASASFHPWQSFHVTVRCLSSQKKTGQLITFSPSPR